SGKRFWYRPPVAYSARQAPISSPPIGLLGSPPAYASRVRGAATRGRPCIQVSKKDSVQSRQLIPRVASACGPPSLTSLNQFPCRGSGVRTMLPYMSRGTARSRSRWWSANGGRRPPRRLYGRRDAADGG